MLFSWRRLILLNSHSSSPGTEKLVDNWWKLQQMHSLCTMSWRLPSRSHGRWINSRMSFQPQSPSAGKPSVIPRLRPWKWAEINSTTAHTEGTKQVSQPQFYQDNKKICGITFRPLNKDTCVCLRACLNILSIAGELSENENYLMPH